jgi:hypothetical protein
MAATNYKGSVTQTTVQVSKPLTQALIFASRLNAIGAEEK